MTTTQLQEEPLQEPQQQETAADEEDKAAAAEQQAGTASITHVILDLDGTLLDTERLVEEACGSLVRDDYGVAWDGRGWEQRLGKRPLEAAAALIAEYELPACTTPAGVVARVTELLAGRWATARAMPGSARLIAHLARHGVPMALASSSPRASIAAKLAGRPAWAAALCAVVAGDDVARGKPAPDIFLEAARRLGAPPDLCLVVEDAPAGVAAAKAAGMRVLAVPSGPGGGAGGGCTLYAGADEVAGSLLEWRPEAWGLPPWTDLVAGGAVIPLDAPWRASGRVVQGRGGGWGSGRRRLVPGGAPTATLDEAAAEGQACGVYVGWAGLGGQVYKAVVSVSWRNGGDTSGSSSKSVEPWLLHAFDEEEFYGREVRVLALGFVRGETDFRSLEAEAARVREDGRVAEAALDEDCFARYRDDPFLTGGGAPAAVAAVNGESSSNSCEQAAAVAVAEATVMAE